MSLYKKYSRILFLTVSTVIIFSVIFFASETPLTQAGDCDYPSQCYLDARLADSDQKEQVRDFLLQQRLSLPLQNSGQDYGLNVIEQIKALPANGGTIVLKPGRYVISSQITVTKSNVTIKAAQFGDVIFEAKGLSGSGQSMFYINRLSSWNIENLILWGEKEYGTLAINLEGTNSTISNNALINFDYALLGKFITPNL